jgi:glutamate carboxypeptidase
VLNKNQFKDYGKITVLINADEEVSSPASRQLLVKLGAEHDATLSFEGSLYNLDLISLTTSGVGALNLNVTGKASHAGASPETGRNALYELAFQIQQMRNLSNASEGLKVNWTLANAGSTRNVIPSNATASADVRILKSDSFDKLENQLKEIVKTKQIPDTVVDITLERRRPALAASPKSLAMGDYAKKIYAELGRDLVLITTAVGAGTDAAFAAQDTDNPVIESLGLQGFGAHSDNDEYVLVSSITPRMYLATRLIMDLSQGKINLK